MAKNKDKNLIIAIVAAAVLISGSLIYLGSQLGGTDARIAAGIEDYVKKQQQGQQAPTPSGPVDVDEDGDPVKGDKNAPITIIEFSDYECPFCTRFVTDTLPQLEEKYISTGKVKLVYRDFPLSFHANARPAAMAAECVFNQGGDDAYYEMHDKIFENQRSINNDNLKAWASEIGYDITTCLDNEETGEEVDADFADGQKAGVRGTPAFFINGRLISGAQPFSVFESIIEEELK